jgi:hypothetical protein
VQKLQIMSTFKLSIFSILKNLPVFLFASIPIFVLHTYFVIEAFPLIRVPFVNSFLRARNASGDYDTLKGFEIQAIGPGNIIAGPGYEFNPFLSLGLSIAELGLVCIFAIYFHRVVLKQTGHELADTAWFSIMWRYFGFVLLYFAITIAFLFAVPLFLPQLISYVKLWLPAQTSLILAIGQIVYGTLGAFILFKLAIKLVATAANDQLFKIKAFYQIVKVDFWPTVGLIILMGIMFAMLGAAFIPVGPMLFGLEMPLGFDWRFCVVIATVLFQFWFQLIFTLVLATIVYSHYKKTLQF